MIQLAMNQVHRVGEQTLEQPPLSSLVPGLHRRLSGLQTAPSATIGLVHFVLVDVLLLALVLIFGGRLGVDGLSYTFDGLQSPSFDLAGALERDGTLYGKLVVVVVAPAALWCVHDGSGLRGITIDGEIYLINGIHKLSLVALSALHTE